MKNIKKSYLIAILVIIFMGVAGAFTNTEYGHVFDRERCYVGDKIIVPEPPIYPAPFLGKNSKGNYTLINPFLDKITLQQKCIELNGVWEIEKDYFNKMPNFLPEEDQRLFVDTRTTIDLKSITLFVIAGAIIALVLREKRIWEDR